MKVKRGEQPIKIDYIERYTMIYKWTVADKAVSKVIRLINAIEIEQEYAEEQLGPEWIYYNLEVREFFQGGVSASRVKCAVGYN